MKYGTAGGHRIEMGGEGAGGGKKKKVNAKF